MSVRWTLLGTYLEGLRRSPLGSDVEARVAEEVLAQMKKLEDVCDKCGADESPGPDGYRRHCQCDNDE